MPFSSITLWEAAMHVGLHPETGHEFGFATYQMAGTRWAVQPSSLVFSLVKEGIGMIPRVGIRIKLNIKYLSPSPVQKNQNVTIIPFFFLEIFKERICFHWKRIKSSFSKPPMPAHHHCTFGAWLDFENPCPTFTLSPVGSWRRDTINCQSCRCANSASCLHMTSGHLSNSWCPRTLCKFQSNTSYLCTCCKRKMNASAAWTEENKERAGPEAPGSSLSSEMLKNKWMVVKTPRKPHVQAKWIVERVLHKDHSPQKYICSHLTKSFHH